MAATSGVILEPVADIKFGQVGIANLRLKRLDPEELQRELTEKVQHAPNLFARAPVVVDLSHLAQLPDLETVRDLIARIREAGMLPVGLSYGTAENEQLARALDLPLFAKFRLAPERSSETRHEPRATTPEPATANGASAGLHHAKPVRSGQQVYARGRDLVLHAAVGSGAEVIADGSIHVYGRLAGRAVAGAHGDPNARIYCL